MLEQLLPQPMRSIRTLPEQILKQILPQPILSECVLLEQMKMSLEQILVEQMLVQNFFW
jgi:hypothetical protein